MSFKHLTRLLLLYLFISSGSALADFQIIVNAQNSTTSLDKTYLKKLYLKKTIVFPNGNNATPVGVETPSTQKAFNSKILNRSNASLNSYWSRLMFSGVATPPVLFASDAQAIDFVARNPDAFAFVSDKTEIHNSRVKIITIY